MHVLKHSDLKNPVHVFFSIASHAFVITWLGAGQSDIQAYGKSCVGLCHAPHACAPYLFIYLKPFYALS